MNRFRYELKSFDSESKIDPFPSFLAQEEFSLKVQNSLSLDHFYSLPSGTIFKKSN